MPAKVYSDGVKAKMARIAKMPQFYGDIMTMATKIMADRFIQMYEKKLGNNELELEVLKDATIARKGSLGYDKPTVPLYGKGQRRRSRRDSYVKMLRKRKLKNGYKIFVSKAIHWSGRMRLCDLFTVHEFGKVIVKKNGTMIRIPKRPAFLNTYRYWMDKKSQDKREMSTIVKKAIVEFINKGEDWHNKFSETGGIDGE